MCCVVLFFPLVTPHSSLSPSVRTAIPNFSVVFSVTLNNNNNNNNEGDDESDANDDDRPANGIKGKNTRGTQKALKILLYFAVDSIRPLARVRVINRRIPSRHFTFFFFRFSRISAAVSSEASLSKLKFLVFE